MKILFTGGRDFQNRKAVVALMDRLIGDGDTVIVGDARGFDEIVRAWCNESLPEDRWKVFYADWERLGPAGGPIRNQAMVDSFPDICIAGPGGPGTTDCTERARKAGIPILRLEP